jgi:phosphate starvation-inducible membrane PsiE
MHGLHCHHAYNFFLGNILVVAKQYPSPCLSPCPYLSPCLCLRPSSWPCPRPSSRENCWLSCFVNTIEFWLSSVNDTAEFDSAESWHRWVWISRVNGVNRCPRGRRLMAKKTEWKPTKIVLLGPELYSNNTEICSFFKMVRVFSNPHEISTLRLSNYFRLKKNRNYSFIEMGVMIWLIGFMYFFSLSFLCSKEHFTIFFVQYLGVTAGIEPAP